MHGYGKPGRCAYAATTLTPGAANFTFFSLYNDQVSAYVLAVHDWAWFTDPEQFVHGFVVSQGKIGSNPVQGSPVVSNRQPMPGQLLSGTAAVAPAFSFFPTFGGAVNGGFSALGGWPHAFPMVVLTPGWSLTAYTANVATPMGLSYFWEVLTADELERIYD